MSLPVRLTLVVMVICVLVANFSGVHLSGHIKSGQRWSEQNRPTEVAGTQLFYPASGCGGKSVFVRQLRGPHLSTCP